MGKMVGLVGMIYVYIHNPGEYCVDMISPPRQLPLIHYGNHM